MARKKGPPATEAEAYKGYDTMLPQGMRSRFQKMCEALDVIDDAVPASAEEMTNAQINTVRAALGTAMHNLAEFVAYRKMAGMDHG